MVPGNKFCNARTEQKLYPVYFEISGCVWFPLNYNCREHVMLADLITCRYTTKQSIKTELEAPYGQAICAWQIFLDMFYFCLCTAKMSIFPWQWSCSKTDHVNFLTRFPGQVNAWWHICSAFSCDEQTNNFLPHTRANETCHGQLMTVHRGKLTWQGNLSRKHCTSANKGLHYCTQKIRPGLFHRKWHRLDNC